MSRPAATRKAPARTHRGGTSPHARRVAEIGREVESLLGAFAQERTRATRADSAARAKHLGAIADHVAALRGDLVSFLGQVRKHQASAARRSARDRADAVAGVQEWVGSLRTEIRKAADARRAAYEETINASTQDRHEALSAIRSHVEQLIATFNGWTTQPAARTTTEPPADNSPATTVQRLIREVPDRASSRGSRRSR